MSLWRLPWPENRVRQTASVNWGRAGEGGGGGDGPLLR